MYPIRLRYTQRYSPTTKDENMPSANRRNVVIGPKTWNQVKSLAKKEERSISDLIREALLELLKKRATTKPATDYNPITDSYGRS